MVNARIIFCINLAFFLEKFIDFFCNFVTNTGEYVFYFRKFDEEMTIDIRM